MKTSRAFTLIELLTVIAIIAILTTVVAVVIGPFQRNAQMVQGMNNMKQLGSGVMNYASSHDGQLPAAGDPQPSFGSAASPAESEAWYNVVPELAGARALRSYRNTAEFFTKSNPLFVPAAKYPQNPGVPLFAIAMNERLRVSPEGGVLDDSAVRLPNFGAASRTIILMETGVPGEDRLPGQGGYTGSSAGNPRTIAARYKRPSSKDTNTLREALTNLLFADGHAESMAAKDVITSSATAYYPQLPEQGGEGKVCWTLDPEAKP
jgi:prepilin-type N-terminal cleavage/methylation domain-containing protein/prepilin-type processing-associated H-X9-DG protein